MRAYKGPNEKKFIMIILVAAFLLRVFIAIYYQWYVDMRCEGLSFASDEAFYLALGWYQALIFKMKDISNLASEYWSVMNTHVKNNFLYALNSFGTTGYSLIKGRIYPFILGSLFFVFGYSPLLARFFNILLGLLAAGIVYFTAKSIFNKDVARLSFAIFAFLPSQLFLSISILRDILIIFAIVFIVFAICKIKTIKNFMILSMPLLFMLYISFYLSRDFLFPLLLTILGIAVLIKVLDFKKRPVSSFILVIIILSFTFTGNNYMRLNGFLRDNYCMLFQRHIYKATQPAESNYRLLPDKLYTQKFKKDREKEVIEIITSRRSMDIELLGIFAGAITTPKEILSNDANTVSVDKMLEREQLDIQRDLLLVEINIKHMLRAYLKGLFYVFFKPFPWHIKKFTHLLASVHMVILYILFPFMCRGVYNTFKNLTKDKLILIIFFFSLASVLALGEGNVGEMFRHREIISFAYVIFGAVGITDIFLKDNRTKNESI